jgi:hypothetical protein
MNYLIAITVAAIAAIVGGAIYYDAYYASIPSAEEIQNLEKALPEGCVAHDIGSYGKIDKLIVIECEDRTVTTTYTYMHEQNGKASEVDQSATFVIR